MKKQLLIAAVAATMTSVAMADISIAGAAKVNYKTTDFDSATVRDTNLFTNEADIKITGKSGETTVVMNFANDSIGNDSFSAEDNYVKTSIEGVSLQAGNWDNGNNALRASERGEGKFEASTSMGPVGIKYQTSGDDSDDSVTLSTELSGVALSYKEKHKSEEIKVSTAVSGVSISYFAMNSDTTNSDKSVVEVSGAFGGVDIKVAQATADSATCISGDTWMGDFETTASTATCASGTTAYDLSNGQDVRAISLKTSIAGNTVEFRNVDVDDVTGSDMSYNKFIVTRPLANGTTFEATYTDLDDSVATNDSAQLDLELAVKF
jgi:hypothetical protein